MGYTHYYTRKEKEFTNEDWDRLCAFTKKAIEVGKELFDVDIFDVWGENPPIINEKEISLNGDASKELDHEGFLLYKKAECEFDFSKTARKPYDSVVTAVLWYLHEELPQYYDISSDGIMPNENEETEWEDGVQLYNVLMKGKD